MNVAILCLGGFLPVPGSSCELAVIIVSQVNSLRECIILSLSAN